MARKDGTKDRLAAMAAKGRRQQWTIDADIDWRRDIIRLDSMPSRFHGALISQFRHGELATAQVCRRLLDHLTESHVRALLVQQIADEERHARAYERYMAMLGEDAPLDPAMAELVDRALEWRGSPLGMVVAFHIMLEGEALRTLQGLAETMPCPLFRQINTLVTRDETRHVAFGNIYLRDRLTAVNLEERIAIYRFVRSLWDDCAAGILSRFDSSGFLAHALRRRWIAEGWARHRRAMVDIGLLGADDMARAE